MKLGLVLEGGGLRGMYTVGVLDAFAKYSLMPDYIVGVSAGAANGLSFVSNQEGRGKRVNLNYIKDKRYLNMMNLAVGKPVFGFDFIYDEIPNRLDLFDYDSFFGSPCEYSVGVTNMKTGKAEYFSKDSIKRGFKIVRASCSVPVFTDPVEFEGETYVDGGVADPIPLEQAFKDGCDKAIVVLTHEREFVHGKQSGKFFYSRKLRKYPQLVKLLDNQHNIYADAQESVRRAEQEGRAFVIAPSKPLHVPFYETRLSILENAYNLGFADAIEKIQHTDLSNALSDNLEY